MAYFKKLWAPVSRKPRALLRLVRIQNLFMVALAQLLTAICLIFPNQSWYHTLSDWRLWALVVSTVMIAAGGYIINDYYDVKIDYINRPQRVVIGRELTRRKVMALHTGLNVLGFLIGLVLHWQIALIHLFSATLLWLYSNQLKRLPFIGNFSIALLTGLSIFIVAVLYRQAYELVFIYGYFAGGMTLLREIIKDMEDEKGDKTFGCKTLPIVLGFRKTKWVVYILLAVIIVSFYSLVYALNKPVLSMYFILLILPGVYFVYRLYWADRVRHYRFLSTFSKWIMLSGVLSMLFFYF